MARARRLERYLTQPFFTIGSVDGANGRRVPIKDTLNDCETILNQTEFNDNESDYYMIGSLKDLASSS